MLVEASVSEGTCWSCAQQAEKKAALLKKLEEQKAEEAAARRQVADMASGGGGGGLSMDQSVEVAATLDQSTEVPAEPAPAPASVRSNTPPTLSSDDLLLCKPGEREMLMGCGAGQDEPSSRSDSEEEEQMVVYYGGPFAEGQEHTWAYLPELRSMWQKGEVNSKTKVWMDTPEFGEKWARLKKHAEESAPNPLLALQAVHLDGSRGLGMLSACATTL